MANTDSTAEALFYAGKMNKDLDERFIPQGEYIDALNIRVGSTELGASDNSNLGSMGALENSKGNVKLTEIKYASSDKQTIGVYEDGSNETVYWFVASNSADLLLSYDVKTETTRYHLVDSSVLNFNKKYLINGINKVDNLLFWTDNLNPPRRIDVTKSYPIFGIDESDISVIVAPPMNAPLVSLYNTPKEENYILDKFQSFSYRYKYENGEYSALSQFSDVAFEPREFSLDYSSFENIGMNNSFNSVLIKFNTGSKKVIGIDVCFKLSDSTIINIIEKFDKSKEGWLDDKTQSLSFTNRKIYTTLAESELLRLYDNVPRIAKAQTSIGNRIMYGNYVDGYDVGQVDYSLEVINDAITDNTLPVSYSSGVVYNIDPASTRTIVDSNINIDFTGYQLKKNFVLSIDFNIISNSYSGAVAFNNPPSSPGPGASNNFSYTFSFLLEKDYDSVYQLATSQEFIDAVSTHKVYADANKGNSLTDIYNADKVAKQADGTYGIWNDIDSGILGTNGAFLISASSGSNILGIQCPAVKFRTEFPTGTFLYGYQYFNNTATDVYFAELGAKRSLHSNRDYEVAIVYMDDYLRSSTALVDTENTVFIDPEYSGNSNSIRVTLKSLPPVWATKYKFVLKQSVSNYETVYTNLFFKDSLNNTWFKLEGQNRQKVSENQTLIVKKDTNGIVSNLVNATVLELTTQAENFIPDNLNDNDEKIIEPAGLYMRLRPSGFSAEYDPNSFRYNGSVVGESYAQYYFDELNPDFKPNDPVINTNRQYRPFAVPIGSQITFKVGINRRRRGPSCDSYSYEYNKTFVTADDYDNMFEWFNNEGPNLNEGVQGGGEAEIDNNIRTTFLNYNESMGPLEGEFVNNFFFQAENASTGNSSINKYGKDYEQGRLRFVGTSGYPNCGSTKSRVTLDITVQTGSGVLIFETKPDPSNGEIYYENSQNFDIATGYHNGNVQNQTSTQPAVIDLDFFNCFTFGNGAESYKINDALTGVPFYLGSRVTAVSQEDFKEANRYASITYSGIYNSETNINKLNEFNLALVNWKDCEKSFGPINVLHARTTDMLVLQEDKVSNVLVGKNLLSDAVGGGAVTSTPEVLGTQIARIEEYGISNNPESFVVYGYDSYFTDTKRNVVINLKGDDLIPISNYGMSSWFRNSFKDRIGYQNIGGYDPYMKEYVLSVNDKELPSDDVIYNCGTEISQKQTSKPYSFTMSLGDIVGDVVINYNFSSGSAGIVVTYDGVDVVDETMTASGSYSFNKNSVSIDTIEVSVTPINATYDLLINCPSTQSITVVRVVLNSVDSVGQTIHNNYNWTLGTSTSTSNTDFIIMEADGVSLYDADTAQASYGVIPAFGSTIKMSSNKLVDDTFVFNNNKFKYLVSDDLYTEAQINELKLELDTATPVLNPSTGNYDTSFVYNNPNNYQYLYLVWDYSISTSIDLCYDATSFIEPCNCNCDLLISSITTTDPTNIEGDNGTATIVFEGGTGPFSYTLNSVSQGSATSPLVINGLSASTSYTVEIIDTILCSDSTTFTLGESSFYFDADYIMLTYEFTDGMDLDTRTRIAIPDIGQNTQQDYIGWSVESVWPTSGTPILTWGGDNQGVGFESVLININQFKIDYPLETSFVIDARCFWFNTVGTNPVNVAAILWKGGAPVKNGCYEGEYYCWTNPTATSTGNIDSVPIIITSDGLPNKALSSGQRAATLTYDLTTYIGVLNNNDTTTPSV